MEFILLHADKHQGFYKLTLSNAQITQNRKLVIFLQYIKAKVSFGFVFYFDAKHSDILRGSSQYKPNYGVGV